MKNPIIYLLIIAFIFSYGTVEGVENYKNIKQVEELLNYRITIINNFMYGEKDLSDLKDKLSIIETDKIYDSDVNFMTVIYYNPTDYEKTNKVVIKKVKKIEMNNNELTILATLEWLIESKDELSIETIFINDYNIKCVLKDNKLYLASLEVAE